MGLYSITVITVILTLVYLWMKHKYNYWSSKGVKGPKPYPFVGNFGKILTLQTSEHEFMRSVYEHNPHEKLVGLYQGFKPSLLLRDPDLIKHVLIKDFQNFQDRLVNSNDSLSNNLFSSEGNTWRVLRHKLTPIFTSGKLKNMIPLIEKCVEDFTDFVDKLVEGNEDHEIRDLASKYTTEVIGSCAFGINIDSFTDSYSPFRAVAQQIFSEDTSKRIRGIINNFFPELNKFLSSVGVKDDSEQLQSFFMKLISKVIEERENKVKERNDFMDLMIELKEQGRAERREQGNVLEIEIDDEIIAAQAVVFYAAGFETSSATMSYLFYELALNQDMQERAYKEIVAVSEKYDGKLNYDATKEMTYLSACFDETLRKHPNLSFLMRQTKDDYTFTDINLKIEKGTPLLISVLGLHLDPEHFKNPEVFDPERFMPENKANMRSCVYLPFGDGPRNCIGMRFAKVQSMMGTASFLKKFKVEPSKKTADRLTYNPKSLTLTAKDGIWLKIVKRQ